MLKKQGIIEVKLSPKPSFKHLINVEGAKATSRSKSKSKISLSNNKISQIPNKSPRKVITRPSQNNSLQYTEEPSGSESPHYTTVKSQVSIKSGSKSPKKHKSPPSAMNHIIRLKNKLVVLQKQLDGKQEVFQKQKAQINNNANQRVHPYTSEIAKLKNMSEYIDEYLQQFRTNSQSLQKLYKGKVEEIEKVSDSQQFKEMSTFRKNMKTMEPRMDILQNKLLSLQKLLQ